MGESDEPAPLTEPIIIDDVFATGIEIEPINGELRLVAWSKTDDERRIVGRLVLPDQVARGLVRTLNKVLSRRGH